MILPIVMLQFVLLAVGIYLIASGIRGRLRLSDPRCSKCSYDLRTFGERPTICAECGADLTVPGSVCYADRQRQPYKTYVGAVVVLSAVIVPLISLLVIAPSNVAATAPINTRIAAGDVQTMSNSQLIDGIGTNLNNPSLWTELQARSVNRTLSDADVGLVIGELITILEINQDQSIIIGLMRSRDFVQSAIRDDRLSDQLLSDLLTALYAHSAITVDLLGRVHQSDFILNLNVPYPDFRRHLGFDVAFVIHTATINGEEQSISHGGQRKYAGRPDGGKVISLYRHSSDVEVSLPALPIGEYEVVLDIELAVFPPVKEEDLPTLWKNYPDKWPPTLLRDRREIKEKFTVVDKGTPLTTLIDDASSGKAFETAIIVTGVTIMPALDSDGLIARVGIAYGSIPNLDYVFEVAVEVEGFPLTETSTDQLVAITDGEEPFIPDEASLQAWEDEFDLPASATGQEQINIHLIPVPNGGASATQHLDRFWSKELIFRDVPIRRASDQTK